MKRTVMCFLGALLFCVTLPAGAHTKKTPTKTIHLSGTVGADGKTLVSDRDNRIWNVANPETLKASEGKHVAVKALANGAASEIHVRLVRLVEQRTTVKLDDVAFRR